MKNIIEQYIEFQMIDVYVLENIQTYGTKIQNHVIYLKKKIKPLILNLKTVELINIILIYLILVYVMFDIEKIIEFVLKNKKMIKFYHLFIF